MQREDLCLGSFDLTSQLLKHHALVGIFRPKFSLLVFWISLQRVHLDIQVGEHANDYAEIAAKDKLSELQLRVRQLLEQIEQIQKEQNYQRVKKGGLWVKFNVMLRW